MGVLFRQDTSNEFGSVHVQSGADVVLVPAQLVPHEVIPCNRFPMSASTHAIRLGCSSQECFSGIPPLHPAREQSHLQLAAPTGGSGLMETVHYGFQTSSAVL